MSEFEDYFSEYENKHNCSPEKRECFEAGQQSQQAKIDELQKLRSLDEMAINQLAQANQVWQIKCDELQGRIDEAMDYITESGGVNLTSEMALNHILKGNKDEN